MFPHTRRISHVCTDAYVHVWVSACAYVPVCMCAWYVRGCVSVYACSCACFCMQMRVWECTNVRFFVFACMHVYICLCVCVCVFEFMTCIYIYIYMSRLLCVREFVHVFMHTFFHLNACTCTHIRIFACFLVCMYAHICVFFVYTRLCLCAEKNGWVCVCRCWSYNSFIQCFTVYVCELCNWQRTAPLLFLGDRLLRRLVPHLLRYCYLYILNKCSVVAFIGFNLSLHTCLFERVCFTIFCLPLKAALCHALSVHILFVLL